MNEIIRAAERLFAAQGIDGVSLREINRSAGQSNTGAVQHHFGDCAPTCACWPRRNGE